MSPPFTRVAMRITGPLLAWLACFALIYVLGAVSCAEENGRDRISGTGLAVSIAMLLATTAFTAWQIRRAVQQRQRRSDQNSKFAQFLVLGLGAVGLMGLALLALPLLAVHPSCAGQPLLVSSGAAAPQYARSYTGRYQ